MMVFADFTLSPAAEKLVLLSTTMLEVYAFPNTEITSNDFRSLQ